MTNGQFPKRPRPGPTCTQAGECQNLPIPCLCCPNGKPWPDEKDSCTPWEYITSFFIAIVIITVILVIGFGLGYTYRWITL